MVGRGAASYGLSSPRPGAAEQDPELWLSGIQSALAKAMAGLDATRVTSVAVSGQQHGLVVLNAEHGVIRPCKLWCDVESAPQVLPSCAPHASTSFHAVTRRRCAPTSPPNAVRKSCDPPRRVQSFDQLHQLLHVSR